MSGIPSGEAFGTPSIEITHYLWIEWTRIAQRHLLRVRATRAEALRRCAAGQHYAEEIMSEFADSLIVISACAHALEGIEGELKTRVPSLPNLGPRPSRHDFVREAIKAAFKLSNEDGKKLKSEFSWLYDLRDAAVHPVAKQRPAVPHPISGNGSYEAARYCLESADRAMALLLDVLGRLQNTSRARTAEVKKYGEFMVDTLSALRAFPPP